MKTAYLTLFLACTAGACGEKDSVKSKYVDERQECFAKDPATGDTIQFSLRMGGCQTVTYDEFGNAIGSGLTFRRKENVVCTSGAESLELERRDTFHLVSNGVACEIDGLDDATLRFYFADDAVVLGIERSGDVEKQQQMRCQPVRRIVRDSRQEC